VQDFIRENRLSFFKFHLQFAEPCVDDFDLNLSLFLNLEFIRLHSQFAFLLVLNGLVDFGIEDSELANESLDNVIELAQLVAIVVVENALAAHRHVALLAKILNQPIMLVNTITCPSGSCSTDASRKNASTNSQNYCRGPASLWEELGHLLLT
jgi:hypothetical protein